MQKSLFWYAGICLVTLSSPLVAAEEGGGDIMAGSLWTSILSVVIFLLLLLILGKYAWGPILSSLQKREDHIRQSIEDADNARAEAEAALSEYKAQLAKAREESQQIIDKGREAASKLAEDLQQKAREEASSLRDRAQQDIASAKNQALREIYEQVTTLSVEVAGKIVQKTLNPDDHRQLIEESLTQLGVDDT